MDAETKVRESCDHSSEGQAKDNPAFVAETAHDEDGDLEGGPGMPREECGGGTSSDGGSHTSSDSHLSGLEVIPSLSCASLSVFMTKSIENTFYRYGLTIGRHPWWTILVTLGLCAALSTGMIMWRTITELDVLWTPYGSPFIQQKEWIDENFPRLIRFESAIIIGPNVLKASFVQYLAELNANVSEAKTKDGLHSYLDSCVKDLEGPEEGRCYQDTILKIWNMNSSLIHNLTDEQVVLDVTEALSGDKASSYEKLFSGLEFDPETKRATKADAILNVWLIKENGTKTEGQERVDGIALAWEEAFLEVTRGENALETLPPGARMEVLAERSFDDEIFSGTNSNYLMLAIGSCLILIYVALVLGRLNTVDQRIFLSFMGMAVVGLSIMSSYGLCFFWGIFYADMHPIIPFVLMGIGVDDMFVIVQTLENLSSSMDHTWSIPKRLGYTMKKAGVSITVTSLTDMVAFLFGATTKLPVLRAFCIFTAIGIFFLYFFAATFFVACLALDERRVAERRVLACSRPKSETWKRNKFSTINYGKSFFTHFSNYLLTWPAKVTALALVGIVFAMGVYGVTQIKSDFDPVWYMRNGTYQQRFYSAVGDYFPGSGEKVDIFVGKIKYWEHLSELHDLSDILANSSSINQVSVTNWFPKFYETYCVPDDLEEHYEGYGQGFFEVTPVDCTDEIYFKQSLLIFLSGFPNFYLDFKFNVTLSEVDILTLLDGGFEITASKTSFQHVKMADNAEELLAMDTLKEALEAIEFVEEDFKQPIPYAVIYVTWEANRLISKELIRTLSLTFVAVAIVSALMVADIRVSFFVMLSVVLTMTNCAGYAHYLGLTIEIVTSMLLILSCGLALDYAAHIGVAYITFHGKSREERTKSALIAMGTPVFHGGFSTFIVIALLIFSRSYIFLTFFKMFAMVVMFGLFHGLIFLPVILSLMGPQPPDVTESDSNRRNEE